MVWKRFYEYKVSEYGDVIGVNGFTRKPSEHKRGYLCMWFSINGKKKKLLIHRVVAELFIPNPYNKEQVNHKDGNKKNNHVSNLEWVTNNENRQHAVKHNLIAKGKTLAKKLTFEIAEQIRKEYVPGSTVYGQYALAKKYCVSQSLVMHILQGKIWKSA